MKQNSPLSRISIYILLAFSIGLNCSCSKHEKFHGLDAAQQTQIFEEITSTKSTFRNLAPNFSGSTLAYVRAVEDGRALFLLDLETMRTRRIKLTNEVVQVYGWSSDDRYLAFAQVSPVLSKAAISKGTYENDTYLCLYDSHQDSVKRLTQSTGRVEGPFAWIKTNTFFFSSKSLAGGYSEKFIGYAKDLSFKKVFNHLGESVAISETDAAFVDKCNIQICQMDAPHYPQVRSISSFRPGAFDDLKWLRFNRESSNFLFCSRPENSNWRYVFKYDPKKAELSQLSFEDTYNGQWIQNGSGVAFVANRSNHFSLVVSPKTPADGTNLFVDGSVVNYTAAPGGNKIYATAAIGMEPHGIWEYDIIDKKLRRVVEGSDKPRCSSSLIVPEEKRARSANGLQIPYFVYSPAPHSETNTHGKHPVIIYLPAPTWQAQKVFENKSQLYSNLGFYYIAVNYLGCDGYGKQYSGVQSASEQAANVMAVWDAVRGLPSVDQDNVFLYANSAGGNVALELVATAPKMWRGCVLDHSSSWDLSARSQSSSIPPIFLVTGDQERFLPAVKEFQSWAQERGIAVSSIISTNCGHLNWKTAELASEQRQILNFFEKHME